MVDIDRVIRELIGMKDKVFLVVLSNDLDMSMYTCTVYSIYKREIRIGKGYDRWCALFDSLLTWFN